jgi:hypothetical protein
MKAKNQTSFKGDPNSTTISCSRKLVVCVHFDSTPGSGIGTGDLVSHGPPCVSRTQYGPDGSVEGQLRCSRRARAVKPTVTPADQDIQRGPAAGLLDAREKEIRCGVEWDALRGRRVRSAPGTGRSRSPHAGGTTRAHTNPTHFAELRLVVLPGGTCRQRA